MYVICSDIPGWQVDVGRIGTFMSAVLIIKSMDHGKVFNSD